MFPGEQILRVRFVCRWFIGGCSQVPPKENSEGSKFRQRESKEGVLRGLSWSHSELWPSERSWIEARGQAFILVHRPAIGYGLTLGRGTNLGQGGFLPLRIILGGRRTELWAVTRPHFWLLGEWIPWGWVVSGLQNSSQVLPWY